MFNKVRYVIVKISFVSIQIRNMDVNALIKMLLDEENNFKNKFPQST